MRACRVASVVAAVFAAPLAAAGDVPVLKVELVATGLQAPVHVTAAPGTSDPLFVVEQSGRVRVIAGGVVLAQPFLDLTDRVRYFGEEGLLSIAFHPAYAENGRVFVYYSDLDGHAVVARFTTPDPTVPVGDPGSEVKLFTITKQFAKHNGGALAFGPDGYLYLATGDGGGNHDPNGNAQSLGVLLGKVLRLDVDGGEPYAIPPDNPFVGVPGAREEIFAYGFRNPWRGGIDAATGAVFVGDVGNFDREELDHVVAGRSYGWDCVEGDLCQSEPGCTCPDAVHAAPVLTYDHNVGCAILGGPVYRGALLPGLEGRVLVADYCVSRVWSYAWDGVALSDEVEHTAQLTSGGSLGLLTSFGEDGLGELYLTAFFPGAVYRIVAADPDPDCDGDGTPDAVEILSGAAFDVNENLIPDACELLLTGSHFISGQLATMDFIGAQPGDPVAFLWTTRGIGQGPCFYGGAWCLSLLAMPGPNPIGILGVMPADAQGSAHPAFYVPDYPTKKAVALQAVVVLLEHSLVSNPILKVIP